MLCQFFKIKFDREYLKGLLDSKINTNQKIDLDMFSDVLLNYGFMIANTKIRREDLMRASKFTIVYFKNHI